jgi:hypothetical protein
MSLAALRRLFEQFDQPGAGEESLEALCPIAASALDIDVSQRAMTTAHVHQAGRNSMLGYGREAPVNQQAPPDRDCVKTKIAFTVVQELPIKSH